MYDCLCLTWALSSNALTTLSNYNNPQQLLSLTQMNILSLTITTCYVWHKGMNRRAPWLTKPTRFSSHILFRLVNSVQDHEAPLFFLFTACPFWAGEIFVYSFYSEFASCIVTRRKIFTYIFFILPARCLASSCLIHHWSSYADVMAHVYMCHYVCHPLQSLKWLILT